MHRNIVYFYTFYFKPVWSLIQSLKPKINLVGPNWNKLATNLGGACFYCIPPFWVGVVNHRLTWAQVMCGNLPKWIGQKMPNYTKLLSIVMHVMCVLLLRIVGKWSSPNMNMMPSRNHTFVAHCQSLTAQSNKTIGFLPNPKISALNLAKSNREW